MGFEAAAFWEAQKYGFHENFSPALFVRSRLSLGLDRPGDPVCHFPHTWKIFARHVPWHSWSPQTEVGKCPVLGICFTSPNDWYLLVMTNDDQYLGDVKIRTCAKPWQMTVLVKPQIDNSPSGWWKKLQIEPDLGSSIWSECWGLLKKHLQYHRLMNCYIYIHRLVVWNINFIFPYRKNTPNWL